MIQQMQQQIQASITKLTTSLQTVIVCIPKLRTSASSIKRKRDLNEDINVVVDEVETFSIIDMPETNSFFTKGNRRLMPSA
jgi:hypothetical protein